MEFNTDHVSQMDSRYRVNLFQSLTGPKPAHLIGTTNGAGIHNLAVFSSIMHLGSNPPFFGFISRPETVRRDTLTNIRTTLDFTINIITEEILESAHLTSGKYPAESCEFEATGLTPQLADDFDAPAVTESPVKLFLTLEQIIPLEMNGTLLVIGKVGKSIVDDSLLGENGFVDIAGDGKGMSVSGSGSYFSSSLYKELPYIGEPKGHK